MNLRLTLRFSILLFFVGFILFYSLSDFENTIWFALGGLLALVNLFVAALVVAFGLKSLKSATFFLIILLFKSLVFVSSVALVLVFLKPKVLPFTLGILLVIFGAIGAAFFESRRYLKKRSETTSEVN